MSDRSGNRTLAVEFEMEHAAVMNEKEIVGEINKQIDDFENSILQALSILRSELLEAAREKDGEQRYDSLAKQISTLMKLEQLQNTLKSSTFFAASPRAVNDVDVFSSSLGGGNSGVLSSMKSDTVASGGVNHVRDQT